MCHSCGIHNFVLFINISALTLMTSSWTSSIYYVRKISQKTNISYPLIRTRTCAIQGVRNASFSKGTFLIISN